MAARSSGSPSTTRAAVQLHREESRPGRRRRRVPPTRPSTEASREIGLLAHFLGDLLMPHHSNVRGAGLSDEHLQYELLVQAADPLARRRARVAQPEPDAGPLTNVRRMALSAASHSREWYEAVHASMTVSPTALTQVGRDATKVLLRRAADDMADVIWSVDQRRRRRTRGRVARGEPPVAWREGARDRPAAVRARARRQRQPDRRASASASRGRRPTDRSPRRRCGPDAYGTARWTGPVGKSPSCASAR